ncbi:MAG: UvrD-helicase domain-containing protein [Motiliproteus sp.]
MSLNIEFISAGAGSGKTYTLTEKLKALLATGDIEPRGVIATTFTRLAAGELRERVRESLMQSGQMAMANQMGQAGINTVNGVCGELLKRFSFEAGLSPEQTVVEDGEANRLFGEAMDQVLEGDSAQIRTLNALAHRLSFFDKGKPQWRSHVKDIADAARTNNCSPEQLADFAEQSASGLLAHFRQPIKRDLNAELLGAINTAIAAIDLTIDTTGVTKKYHDLIRGAGEGLRNHRLTWAEWVKLSKTSPGAKSKTHAEAIKLIAEDFELHPQLHQDIRQYCQAVYGLAGNSLVAYQQLKQQQGLVDFVDQELQLYNLLEDPQVKETLACELQLLMVDEFQDTSPIQLALFVRLAALAKKVIWVGDIKQAIYGFRGSDPSLMQAVLETILADGSKPQVLEKSWRSRPALVNYCNAVFSQAFAESIPQEQVVLAAARTEVTNEAAVAHWSLSGNMAKKMASIASGIQELVASEYQVVDKASGNARPLRFGDVAVLCRSNDRLSVLAKACNDAGIAVGYKRFGLLATPEGALAMACLRRLADKKDTLAAAEIRSLVTGESADAWLPERLALVASEVSNSEWGEVGTSELPALSALAQARKTLNTLTPVEAMQEALSKGDVRAVVNQWGPNVQRSRSRLANLDCLVTLAGDYEQHCEVRNLAATVPGLVMWLNQLHADEEDWQAVGQDDDTVTLVTHHGAKGLEWPVVLAVDLEKAVRPRLWGLAVLPRAEGFDVAEPLANRSLRFWPYPFGQQAAGIAVKDRIDESEVGIEALLKATEEEKRLLYVSLTRPRDLLVLPLSVKGPYKSLDTLGSDWMIPDGDSLTLPDGASIPTQFKLYESLEPVDGEIPPYSPHWLPQWPQATDILPRKFSPSSAAPLESAKMGRVIELGDRLPLDKVEDMALLGSALHGVIAASINHTKPFSLEQAQSLLASFGVDQQLSAAHALEASQRFINHIHKQFEVTRCLVEYPVTTINELGQEATGFIDLIIETADGWIIIDHKSSPAPRSEWETNALKYSGQLAIYRRAIEKATDKPVLECWVHFAVTGGMVEVC